jgi:hypothetical protein
MNAAAQHMNGPTVGAVFRISNKLIVGRHGYVLAYGEGLVRFKDVFSGVGQPAIPD